MLLPIITNSILQYDCNQQDHHTLVMESDAHGHPTTKALATWELRLTLLFYLTPEDFSSMESVGLYLE